MTDILNADVVIVGSGVAGAMIGYSLARRGVQVLILEAGPRVDREKPLMQFRNSPTKRRTRHTPRTRKCRNRTRTTLPATTYRPARFRSGGLRGAALGAAISDHTARELAIGPSVEILPDPDNRVTLASQLDPLGLPRPRIYSKSFNRYELDGMKVGMQYTLAIMNALAATEVQSQGPVTDGAVMGGTCRMGNDPRTSVVDRNLRSHDHSNLYIVGSAAFPTITASPPTLTIAAFALRAGLQIGSDLGR
jgi:choline dehydrogenase-like flavoprotein